MTTDSIRSQRIRLVAVAVVALVVGLIVGGFQLLPRIFESEEPPIRVRGGSIDLELPTNTKKWEEKDNNSMTWWQIKRGKKTPTSFNVLVATTAPAKCEKGLQASTTWVKITDSGGNWFKLDLELRRTKVTANDKKLVMLGEEVLTLKPGDYIAQIDGDQGTICRFGKDEFVGADLR